MLKTLPDRQIKNGLAESVKMAATFDEELFKLFENETAADNIDTIIAKSVEIKKQVVEKDERESGLRRVLNFGHTIGHAIESTSEPGSIYHGECVGIGMLPMCSDEVRVRIINVLKKLGLPTTAEFDADRACEALLHDKKSNGSTVTAIKCDKIGSFYEEKISNGELADMIRNTAKGAYL